MQRNEAKIQSHNSVGKWLLMYHHFEIVKENPWCKFRYKSLCVKYNAKQVSEKCEGPMCVCYSTDEAQKLLPSLKIKWDIDTISGQKKEFMKLMRCCPDLKSTNQGNSKKLHTGGLWPHLNPEKCSVQSEFLFILFNYCFSKHLKIHRRENSLVCPVLSFISDLIY